jgi:hypothetical protein
MRGDEECSKIIEWLCRAMRMIIIIARKSHMPPPLQTRNTSHKKMRQEVKGSRRAGASGMKMTRDLFKGYRLDVEGEFFKG